MSRTGNSREQKVVQSEGVWKASGDDGCGYRVSLRTMTHCSRIGCADGCPTLSNTLNTTELVAFNAGIIWYMNSISIKHYPKELFLLEVTQLAGCCARAWRRKFLLTQPSVASHRPHSWVSGHAGLRYAGISKYQNL